MNSITKIALSVVALLLFALPALAQIPPPPPATPIDGGLSLLLAGGALYGIKKIRDSKKNS